MLHTDQPLPCSLVSPELWFSEDKDDQQQAKMLCKEKCPMILACLEDCLLQEEQLGTRLKGIHGGLTPAEREITTLKRTA